jgi:hypothetical protein
VIVVIGSPLFQPGSADLPSGAAGLAAGIAATAAAAERTVQLVGRIGEDPAGEETLLALARGGIGHVATLRDPAHPTRAIAPATEVEPDAIGGDVPSVTEPDTESQMGTSLGPVGSATLDRGDLELALRYLGTFSVVVIAEPLDPAAVAVVADAVAYNGATLVVIVPAGDADPALPLSAIALEAPVDDPDGVFARTVGAFAAELDGGLDPATALASAVAAHGWERAGR